MKLVKIPKVFYVDHCERDLEAPEIIKETKSHYFIKEGAEHMTELLSDAIYYSDCAGQGWNFEGMLGMQSSARATVKAIRSNLIEQRDDWEDQI